MNETQSNSPRRNLELRGSITTVTPFANSPAGCKGTDKSQLLPKMPVFLHGAIVEMPFISASAIRGVLRRAAAEEVVEVFRSHNEDVKFSDWLLFSVGGIKGDEKEDCSPRDRYRYIENNPLVALFGAGSAGAGGMIGSKLHIAHAIPDKDIKPVIVESARAHEDKSLRLLEILPQAEQELAWRFTLANRDRAALDKQVKEKERELKAARKKQADTVSTIGEELNALKDRLEKAEAVQKEIGSSNAIGRPLSGYEVIPAGAEIQHRMSLDVASLPQIGLFFAALRRFAREPVIGAHRAHGCGCIRGEYRVFERGENGAHPLGTLEFGEISDESSANPESQGWEYLRLHGESLQALAAEAATWRETVTPANFRPRDEQS